MTHGSQMSNLFESTARTSPNTKTSDKTHGDQQRADRRDAEQRAGLVERRHPAAR